MPEDNFIGTHCLNDGLVGSLATLLYVITFHAVVKALKRKLVLKANSISFLYLTLTSSFSFLLLTSLTQVSLPVVS